MGGIISRVFSKENEFFALANAGKRISNIYLSALILPAIFLIISGLLTQFVFAPLYFGDPKTADSSVRELFGLFSLFGVLIILLFLWIRFYEKRPFYTIGFTSNTATKKYLMGFGIGMVMNIAVILILFLLGYVEINDLDQSYTIFNLLGWVILFLFAYIIQGSAEEILARGWMLQVIGARYKPWLGVLITSIVFALLHSGNDGANVLAVINLFLIAILLSLFVMKDKSIWSACGWHTAWNWTMGNIFGLSVSGTKDKTSLMNFDTVGNELFSGGEFGIEASVILTLILALFIVLQLNYLLMRNRQKNYRAVFD